MYWPFSFYFLFGGWLWEIEPRTSCVLKGEATWSICELHPRPTTDYLGGKEQYANCYGLNTKWSQIPMYWWLGPSWWHCCELFGSWECCTHQWLAIGEFIANELLGSVFEGYICSPASVRWAALLCNALSTLMLCLTTAHSDRANHQWTETS
jgi:hypothetical protein